MSVIRARKEASKRLGLALEQKYRRLVLAGNDQNEIVEATVDLATCFNDNIEFILWVLKSFGGLDVSPPEYQKQVDLPKLPDSLTKHLQ